MRRLFRAAMLVYGCLAPSMLACFDWSMPGDVDAVVADASGDGTFESDATVARDGSTNGMPDSAGEDAAPPPCGPPVAVVNLTSLLHVKMQDLAELATINGNGTATAPDANAHVVLVGAGDFLPGPCEQAVHFVPGVRLEYPEVSSGAPLIEYGKGTIMLWYRPDYDTTDNQEHTLLRSFGLASRGGIRLSRIATGTKRVRFQWYAAEGGVPAGGVSSTTDLPKDVWSHLAVTWTNGELPRIYIGGVHDPGENAQIVTGAPTTPSDTINFTVGASPTGDGGLSALGSIDDLRIYSTTIQ